MRFLNETVTACGVEAPLRCYIPDECGKTAYAGPVTTTTVSRIL